MERAVFEVEFEDPEEWSTEFYGRMKSQLKLLCQVGGDDDDNDRDYGYYDDDHDDGDDE